MNPATTPKVQYTYADGTDNTVRPTVLVYPNGRELHYDYGSTGEMDDAASHVASLIDDDGTTHLVDYSYLGRGGSAQSVNAPFGRGFVIADSPQPEVKWTMVDLTNTNDPDTGDIYTGLDRFGRVKDLRWRNTDSNTDLSRVEYGYDRASNRIWRKNPTDPNAHYDWLYTYDAIQRLKLSGMRWTHTGAQHILTLRSILLSQTWTAHTITPSKPQRPSAPCSINNPLKSADLMCIEQIAPVMCNVEEFQSMCAKHGMAATKERIAVVNEFNRTLKPISLQQVAYNIQSTGQRVSSSTVHRTKAFLVKWGLAKDEDFCL